MSNIKNKETGRSTSAVMAGMILLGSAIASGATNQFRGVNWADERDNFQSGVVYISGLSSTDTYASASVVADKIVGQFMSKLGSNSVRMPINEATAKSYWGTYTGAIDMALTKGRVVLCYWGKASGANPPDMNAWWSMWSTVMAKYGKNPNFYVEVFNEPSGYSKTDLLNLYDQWLKKFPEFPRKRIILDGSGLAWGVSDVGSDKRFDSCFLAVHDYTFFAGSDMTTETKWANHIKGYVGAYSDRTIATEWGGPMSTGSKNGITYQPMDYSKPATNFFEAYIRGISQQLRDWKMGSFYWPGLRDGDWYSMTTRSGSGANIVLTVSNKSGLARMQYSWVDTAFVSVQASGPNAALSAHPKLTSEGSRLRLEFTPQSTGSGTVKLFGTDGRMAKSFRLQATAHENYSRSFDLSGLSNGLFVADLEIDGRPSGRSKVLLNR
ncbi:MAG: carbohydrate-binding protein [Fibrobacterota bacterium]|nr:MAG: carbohydrate-binding protein [Fibrobacterota bacterium]